MTQEANEMFISQQDLIGIISKITLNRSAYLYKEESQWGISMLA